MIRVVSLLSAVGSLGLASCTSSVATPAEKVAAPRVLLARAVAPAVVAELAPADGEKPAEKGPARAEGEPFRLPEDESGKILSRVLPPTARPGALNNPGRVVPTLPPPPSLTRGLPLLPTTPPPAPQLPPARPRTPVRPYLVAPEGFGGSERLAVPAAPSFVTEDRTRIDSEDVQVPPPLPALGQPVAERASLEDATGAASLLGVTGGPVPAREAAAPYQKAPPLDPFENRKPLTTPTPPEATTPTGRTPLLDRP